MVFGFPIAPVRGVVALARTLQEQAERELTDTSNVRRKLEDLESAAQSGDLSEGETHEAEKEILRPVVKERPPTVTPEAESRD
jgi:hypothetical protein